MNCNEVRKNLYPLPGQCVLTIETARSIEHLRECQACQDYFAAQAEWVRLLREKAGTDLIPESLREEIIQQIEQKPAGGRRQRLWRSPWAKAALAGLVLGALAVGWIFYRLPSQQMFLEIFRDHARYLGAHSQLLSSDPNDLETWFRGQTDFSVRVPLLNSAELLGGRLCFLRQRKAALVFYRKSGRTISLFQFNGQGISLRALNQTEIDGNRVWRMSFQGYSLAAFERRGVICALVSDLRESELLQLASVAQIKSQDY